MPDVISEPVEEFGEEEYLLADDVAALATLFETQSFLIRETPGISYDMLGFAALLAKMAADTEHVASITAKMAALESLDAFSVDLTTGYVSAIRTYPLYSTRPPSPTCHSSPLPADTEHVASITAKMAALESLDAFSVEGKVDEERLSRLEESASRLGIHSTRPPSPTCHSSPLPPDRR